MRARRKGSEGSMSKHVEVPVNLLAYPHDEGLILALHELSAWVTPADRGSAQGLRIRLIWWRSPWGARPSKRAHARRAAILILVRRAWCEPLDFASIILASQQSIALHCIRAAAATTGPLVRRGAHHHNAQTASALQGGWHSALEAAASKVVPGRSSLGSVQWHSKCEVHIANHLHMQN